MRGREDSQRKAESGKCYYYHWFSNLVEMRPAIEDDAEKGWSRSASIPTGRSGPQTDANAPSQGSKQRPSAKDPRQLNRPAA